MGLGEKTLGRGRNETPSQWTGLGLGEEMPAEEVSEGRASSSSGAEMSEGRASSSGSVSELG